RALTMPEEEQQQHMASMQQTLKRYNIHHWVGMFMDRLSYVKIKQMSLETSYLDKPTCEEMCDSYETAGSRLIFLEYDGALVDYRAKPLMARPDDELLTLLERLSSSPKNRVVIVSAREKANMEDWLGHLNLDIVAEHGVWIKQRGSGWKTMMSM